MTFNSKVHLPRNPAKFNGNLGFRNAGLRCKCINGKCHCRHYSENCINDSSVVFELIKRLPSTVLVPDIIVESAFNQLPLNNGSTSNL